MNVILIGNSFLGSEFKNYFLDSSLYKLLDVYDSKTKIKEYDKVDVIIDFSSPKALNTTLYLAKKYHSKLIIGTTSYSEKDIELIKKASKIIPISLDNNYSMGFQILKMFKRNLDKLNIDYDAYLIETHQKNKKDKPSGSSKDLLPLKEIFSLRGSNISGEHDLKILFENEILDIKHLIISRRTFVFGVLKMIDFLKNKQYGLFHMEDLLKEYYE